MPVYTQNRGSDVHGALPQRTLDYLAHGAVKPNRNNELYFAAQQFKAAGYTLAETEARLLPIALSTRLTESEARSAITSGYNSDKVKDPIGQNFAGPPPSAFAGANHSAPPPPSSPAPQPKPKVNGLPAPIKDGFIVLLSAAFLPGEGVSIAGIEIDSGGHRHPGRGEVLTQERQIERAKRSPINKIYCDPDGVYIRINPMAFGGASDKDVTSYRYVLVEFDLDGNGHEIPKLDQYQALIDSPFPIKVIIHSGGKSLHAWIIVDAGNDIDLFKRRREIVYAYFAAWNVDPKNKNPSRYSRCPEINRNLYDETGALIGVGRQELLQINIGPANWAEYEANQTKTERDQIAAILAIRKINELPAAALPELIKGVLYRGGKMSFGGGSKSFKTWNLMHLLFCIANGLAYLGFPVLQGPVLLVDFELFAFEIRARFEAIARLYKIADPFFNISVITLRGEYLDFGHPVVNEVMTEKILAGAFVMFGFDPLYKALSGYEENSNSDVARVLRPFEKLTVVAQASFAYNQHFSKGNQATKDAIDRIAGAGSFGRDPDCLATFTPLKRESCFRVDIVERSFAPIPAFAVKWQHPVYLRDDSIDPDDLAPLPKRQGNSATANNDNLIMAALYAAEANGGLRFNELVRATGLHRQTLDRRLKALTAKGEIIHSAVTFTYQLSLKNSAQWKAQTAGK